MLHRIVVAASACTEKTRVQRVAPMVYCFCVLGTDATHWGYAAERDTHLMTGRALARAINDICIEDDSPNIEVIVKNTGVEKYFKEFIPVWIAEDRLAQKHSGSEWKKVHLLKAITDARIRKPLDRNERRALRIVTSVARDNVRQIAELAFANDPTLYSRCGTILTDEHSGAPKF